MFTFLARQMVRQADEICVNRALFEQVVEALCLCDRPSEAGLEHEERQQALLELYAVGGLEHFDNNKLLQLATSAAFYRVCEVVHEHLGQFDEIVECYWRDPARRHLTFNYVHSLVAQRGMSAEHMDRLSSAVLSAVSELVKIDARRTAKLLLVTLGLSASQLVEQLSSDDDSLFMLLSGVFDYVNSAADVHISLEPSVYERYVELMCRLHCPSSQIVDFLHSTSGYRLTDMLDICRRYSLTDAVVCLLEKSGDVRGAFALLFDGLREAVTDPDNDTLDMLVKDMIALLLRSSRQLEHTQLETVWFTLLDFLMDTMKTGSSAIIKSMTRQVINAMMSQVALPAVLQRIVANEGGVAGQFGEVRELLSGVLEACAYERTLLSTCARLVNHDLHTTLQSLTRASRSATASYTDCCVVCGCAVIGASLRHSADVICFHCGHVVHAACLQQSRDCKCPVCCRSSSLSHFTPATSPSHSTATSTAVVTSQTQLDTVHVHSVDRLRSVTRSPSRLTVLAELAQLDHTHASSLSARSKAPLHSSILHNEQFALRLAAPPPPRH